VAHLILIETSLAINRSSQQAWWLHVNVSAPSALTRSGNDEKLGRDQLELGGQCEEAGVQRGFDFSLLESFPVVKVGMGKDSAQASRQRGKVSV
jgi:hypothetical protein